MSAKDVSAATREGINKMQRKSFVAVLTRAQAKKIPPSKGPLRRPPTGAAVQNLQDERRFSSLTRLVKTIALI